MSLKELKQEVADLAPEDQLELAAYLQHLREQHDPEYHGQIRRADERLSRGGGVGLDELRKLVKAMDAQGL